MNQLERSSYEPLRYIGVLFIFIVMFVISKKVKKLLWIVIIDLCLIIASVIFYPLTGSKFWLGVSLLIFAVIDIVVKGDPSDVHRGITWFSQHIFWWGGGIWVMMLVSLFVQPTRGMEGGGAKCTSILAVMFCIFVGEYLLQEYIYKIYDYFQKKSKIDKIDRGHVIRMVFLGALCAVAAGGLIYVCAGFITQILQAIYNWFSGLFNNAISNTAAKLAGEVEMVTQSYSDISNNGNEMNTLGNGTNEGLSNALMMILIFGIIVGVIYLATRIFKFLHDTNYIPESEEDVITVIERNVGEQKEEKTVMDLLRFGSSGNQQVRKYYFKTISKRRQKKDVDQIRTMTAGELEKKLKDYRKGGNDELTELTELYNEARYRGKQISKEKVQKARELYRKG